MAMNTKWSVRTPPAREDVEAVEELRTEFTALKSRIEEIGGQFAAAAEETVAGLEKWFAEKEDIIAAGGVTSPSEERNSLAQELNALAERVYNMHLASLTQSEGDL